jgi:hypothetical protein
MGPVPLVHPEPHVLHSLGALPPPIVPPKQHCWPKAHVRPPAQLIDPTGSAWSVGGDPHVPLLLSESLPLPESPLLPEPLPLPPPELPPELLAEPELLPEPEPLSAPELLPDPPSDPGRTTHT